MKHETIKFEQPALVEDIINQVKVMDPGFTVKPLKTGSVDPFNPKEAKMTPHEYVVNRPDYSQMITLDNLFRTSIFVQKQKSKLADLAESTDAIVLPADTDILEKPEFIRHEVHISNILHREEGVENAGVVVVFQTNHENAINKSSSVTRIYISKDDLDKKFIKVGYCNLGAVAQDIHKFLMNGKSPA